MNKPTIIERFADNGEHSHWELIDTSTGNVLWPKPNVWHPASEPPEYGKQVLAYGTIRDSHTKPKFYAATFVNDFWGWSIPGVGGIDITHWCELPTPPISNDKTNEYGG